MKSEKNTISTFYLFIDATGIHRVAMTTSAASALEALELYVDYREQDCLACLPRDEVKVENLELGDFQLRKKESGDICVILERKTVRDFAASIKDGRYKEQKKRLQDFRQAHPHVIIVFILEGYAHDFDDTQWIDNLPYKSIHTCMFHLVLRDKMALYCTQDIPATCRCIRALQDRCAMHLAAYHPMATHQTSQTEYLASTGHINSKKKAQIDKVETYYLQLACLPGISVRKAKDIAHHTDTKCIKELCDKINTRGFDEVFDRIPGMGKKTKETVAHHITSETI